MFCWVTHSFHIVNKYVYICSLRVLLLNFECKIRFCLHFHINYLIYTNIVCVTWYSKKAHKYLNLLYYHSRNSYTMKQHIMMISSKLKENILVPILIKFGNLIIYFNLTELYGKLKNYFPQSLLLKSKDQSIVWTLNFSFKEFLKSS